MAEVKYGLTPERWESLENALGVETEGLVRFFAGDKVGRDMLNRKVNRKDRIVQIGVRKNEDGARLAILVNREVALDLLRAAVNLNKEMYPPRGLRETETLKV